MIITLFNLNYLGACLEQRREFFAVFGEELLLPTDKEEQKKLAAQLYESGFDIGWSRRHLLSVEQKNIYDPISQEYQITYDVATNSEFNNYFEIVRRAEAAHLTHRNRPCNLNAFHEVVTPALHHLNGVLKPMKEFCTRGRWLAMIQILTNTVGK